jgi:hypothetical protein
MSMFHFRKLSIIIPRFFTESADFKEVQLQIVLVQSKQFESCILIHSKEIEKKYKSFY